MHGSEWWINPSSSSTIVLQFGGPEVKTVPGDYTGDGKADIAFFVPASGEWFVLRSEDLSYFSFPFGSNGDIPTPGDYDGDGKFDPSVFRPGGTAWYIDRNSGGTAITSFGRPGDRPVPSVFVR